MLENKKKFNDKMRHEIIRFARAKLICHSNIDAPAKAVTKEAALAVLGVRLSLGFNTLKQDRFTLQAAQVASHMRVMFSVPQDRHSFCSGYPSEPILAEAAAQQLYTFRKRKPSVVVKLLLDHMESGLLDLGQRGEVVARAMLTAAYDRAVEKDHPPTDQPPFYSQGCNLTTFINELFHESYAEFILGSFPDKGKSDLTLRDAFEQSKIRFTHFVEMRDDTATTTDAMYAAFLRGMAIICHPNQPGVDFMIPVLLWDDTLCEEVMTAIFIQVKRRTVAGTKQAYAIDEASVNFFPKPSKSKSTSASVRAESRPYITLIMELGVQPPLSSLAKMSTKVGNKKDKGKAVSKPESSLASKKREETPSRVDIPQKGSRTGLRSLSAATEVEHPRYAISAYGCSSTVYKVVEPKQKVQYAQLLASRDFLASHERQTPESLLAVRKLKPFWEVGPACYHWLKNALLNTEPVENPDHGCVSTGDGEFMEAE